MTKYVKVDNLKLDYSGIVYIPHNDGLAIAKFFANQIANLPAADVAPVVHGKWENIPLKMNSEYFAYRYNLRKKCSVCKYAMPQEYPNFNICPNCGAKMDLQDE